MKKLVMILLPIVALILLSCQSADDSQTDLEPVGIDRKKADEVLLRLASKKLITAFSAHLQGELITAMVAKGPVGTITTCSETAPLASDSFSTSGFTIKRVTDKHRNTNNRATLDEAAILAKFDSAGAEMAYFDQWQEIDSVTVFKYYQPIRIGRACLKCHGNLQTLAPGVMTALRKKYPTDKATGYAIGDLRGMFVVEAEWPVAESHAKALVLDTL
ncbi:MAG: DUF3365 domain-containing protein [candidate division Zixibacteria bacterium]